MGIFSSKYKTYVGTSISRFADTDSFISSKKKGLISSISRNEDVTDHTLDSLINSSGFRAKKAFRYGESSYIFGRPNDTLFAKSGSTASVNTAVTNYLTGLGASEVYYVRYGPYSYDHKFYKHLQSEFNLNFATGLLPTLSTEKGSDVTIFEASLLLNPSNTSEDSGSLIPITVYPIVRKSSTAVERIGAEITYRWDKEVESINHTYDSVGPVLDSTNTFSDYSGGTTSYTNTSVSSTTEVLAPIIENSTVPAVPPNTYAPTEIELRTVTTKKTTTTTVDTYTVNPPYLATLYGFTGQITIAGEIDKVSRTLNSGIKYSFNISATSGSTVIPSMILKNSVGTVLGTGSSFTYTPAISDVYYLSIQGNSRTTGEYQCLIRYTVTPHIGALVKKVYIFIENTNEITTTTKTYNQESLLFSSNFGITTEELAKTFFMAGYNLSGITFLDYKSNTGIAELDEVFSTSYSVPGDYLPRLYFRWNHISEGLDKNTVAYTNGKKLAKKIGINYDDVIEAVHKIDEDRTQADLNQIRSVFLTYALPADATDQIELKYLFKHFKYWHAVIGGYTTTEFLGNFNTNYQLSDSNEHVLVIEDKRFKITIGMQGIWKRTVTGVFDSVGKYGTLKGKMLVDIYVAGGINTVRTFPWHVYRHQTNENTYEEYQVVGLETKYYVEGDHHSASGYTSDVADAKDILYVPINYTLVQEFTLFEQEELMYKSMQIVANSLVVVKVKWYQRSGWSTLFKIAAIVAAFYGFTEGFELLSALATVASVSIAWALELVFAYLIDYLTAVIAIKLFVKAAGEEIALLTAIVLAATGYIQGGGFKSPFATQMLQYSNSIFAEMNASFMREIESLKDDYNSFITEAKTEFKEISDELKKFDNPNKNLTAYLLNSTPTEFLNKTHIGNIGTKVFDVTRNYVDISLRLPYRPTYSEV